MKRSAIKYYKNSFRPFMRSRGFDVVRYSSTQEALSAREVPQDFDDLHTRIVKEVKPFTMTTYERIYGLIESTRYVVENNIPGAIVECGVWRGGSMMTVIRTLQHLGVNDRELYLYDTYEGMTAPEEVDVSYAGHAAQHGFDEFKTGDDSAAWCYASLEDVTKNVLDTGYNPALVHFVKGKVEDTLPQQTPKGEIALLRLDTDWYASTKHELKHLYPLLVESGVLLIDDYGHWQGARKATDEYIAEHGLKILLNRLDYTGRIAIKI